MSVLRNLPFTLELLPTSAYLVGGSVRDALLQRCSDYLDLDFVVPTEAIETARRLAKHYNAGFVVLDAKRKIARVVFDWGTVDVAQQEGESLTADLQRRDFTINAIAYNLHNQQLFDPLQGILDLERRWLRMIAPKNLSDDPLRLLRAYRQAAQLNFDIEAKTRSTITSLAPQLAKVAAERVQTELNYLLSSPQCSLWLAAAYKDGLLSFWLPHATESKLKRVAQVDRAFSLLGSKWGEVKTRLQTSVNNNALSGIALAKLATLVADEVAVAQEQLWRLKYSRGEVRAVSNTLQHLPSLISLPNSPLSVREQYFLFLGVGNAFLILVLLVIATWLEKKVISDNQCLTLLIPLITSYLNSNSQVAHPKPLVTGNDLMQSLSLSPSPQIGTLLTEIQIARLEGKINNFSEAIQFAANWLEIPEQ